MERLKYIDTLQNIKEQAKKACPGILPSTKSMQNYIGHTVINLSDHELTYKHTANIVQTRQLYGMISKISIGDFASNSMFIKTMGI